MRKMSKAAKIEHYDRLKDERDAYERFAWHIVNGHKPDAVEKVTGSGTDDEGVLEFKLYGALRMDGGLLVTVYSHPVNEFDSVECERFEDWMRRIESKPFGIGNLTEIKIACERLRAKRWELLNAPEKDESAVPPGER